MFIAFAPSPGFDPGNNPFKRRDNDPRPTGLLAVAIALIAWPFAPLWRCHDKDWFFNRLPQDRQHHSAIVIGIGIASEIMATILGAFLLFFAWDENIRLMALLSTSVYGVASLVQLMIWMDHEMSEHSPFGG